MKDREGNNYVPVYVGLRQILVGFVSPARQAKKASGRTGRQWRKWRKAERHVAKFFASARTIPEPTKGTP